MERLTQHFLQQEFQCPCCERQKPNLALAMVLEDVREFFNSPVTINSAFRCEEHNKAVGGASNSQHKLGAAADIVVKDVSPASVHDWLSTRPYANAIGLGKYNSFTHVDVRGSKARWDMTNVG